MENKNRIQSLLKSKFKDVDFTNFKELYFKHKDDKSIKTIYVNWDKEKTLFGFYYLEIEKYNGKLRDETFEYMLVFSNFKDLKENLEIQEINEPNLIDSLERKVIKLNSDSLNELIVKNETKTTIKTVKI